MKRTSLRFKRHHALAAATLALVLGNTSVWAGSYQFALPDLATFDTWSTPDQNLTFTGTGFVGMTNDIWSGVGPSWVHTLTLEPAEFDRTLMQVDLAPLAGQTIVSATLSFMLLDGQEEPGRNSVVVNGFDVVDGVMRLNWNAPAHSHSGVVGQVERSESQRQAIDVTSLVDYSVAHEQRWLGMHLRTVGNAYLYTSTHDYPDTLYPDRAAVRLDVITAAVPEPGSWAMLAGGLTAVVWMQRRRKAAAAG